MVIGSTQFNTGSQFGLSPLRPEQNTQIKPFEYDFSRFTNPTEATDYFSYFALDNALADYASFDLSPNQVNFSPEVQSPETQLRDALQKGADYMSPEQAAALEPVAQALGFSSAKNLVHGLRFVPEATREKVLQSLPDNAQTAFVESKTGDLKNFLKEEAHHLVFDAFDKAGARPPQLNPPIDNDPEGLWQAPQLLAIYNNFKSMETRFTPEMLKDMMEPDNGEPLTFERRKTPEASGAKDNILKALSSSMKVAESDQANTVILYNAAFSANPKDIVQSEDVQGFMAAYDAAKDSDEASPEVASLQNMLNYILPEERKLPVSGKMDPATSATLAEFESQQFLNQAEDIINDDKNLPDQDRRSFFGQIADLKRSIFETGYLDKNGKKTPAAEQIKTLVQGLKSRETDMTPASKARLNDLEKTMDSRVEAKSLNPDILERMVSNWFGIMDSGDQKDFAEQVINHEMGHFWENKNNLIESWKSISFQDFEKGDFNHDEAMAATLREGDNDKGYSSDYAKLNPSEDFAESFRLFNRDPDKLIQQNLLKYVVMAGATGAYENDHQGLIAYAQQNGYSQADVAEAVKALRGQHVQVAAPDQTPLTHDRELHLDGHAGHAGHSAFEPNAFQFAPAHDAEGIEATSVHHGLSQTDGTSDEVVNTATQMNVASAASSTKSYQFDLSVANYYPGIESDLDIQAEYVGDPEKPGFVLDNLSQHTKNMEKWRLFSSDSRQSHRFVDAFKAKGVQAFPAEIQAKIPDSVKAKFENPDNRAIYLVMAKLRSEPTLAEDFMKPDQNKVSQDFFEDHFEDLLSGLDVPEALVDYLSHPENLVAVTGEAGKSFLAAETLERNMADAIADTQSNYKTAAQFLTRRAGQDLAALFTTGKYLNFEQDKGFSVNPQHYSKSMIYSALEEKLRNANFGKMVGTFSPERLDELSLQIAKRLDSLPMADAQNSKSWKKDPQLLEQINQIIVEELQANIPEVQNIAADTTG